MEEEFGVRSEYAAVWSIILVILSFLPSILEPFPVNAISYYTAGMIDLSVFLCLYLSWRIFSMHRKTEFRNTGLAFVIYFSLWLVAELSWSFYDIALNKNPDLSVADLFWLLGYAPLFFIFSSTILSYKNCVTRSNLRKILSFWALLFFAPTAYLVYVAASVHSGSLTIAVNALYPVFDGVLLLLLLLLLSIYRKARLEAYWLIIAIGVFFNAAGDLLYLYYDAFGKYYLGSLPDSFFILSYLVMASGFFSITRARIVYFKTIHLPEIGNGTDPKYVLEKKSCYLFEEEEPSRSMEVFCDIVTHGTPGMCLLRSYPETMRKKWRLKRTPIVWLSNAKTGESVFPDDLGRIAHIVSEFLKKTGSAIVFLEGVEYLITHNDFLPVQKMINTLQDLMVLYDSILILTVDPKILDEKEKALLEKGMNKI